MGITNTGKVAAAGLFGNVGSVSAFTYLAYGTGTTGFAATQETLVAESQRAAATVTRITTTTTNDTLQLVKVFTATTTETATEGGVFNAASVGIMGARVVFETPRDLLTGETLSYVHKIVFA